MEQSPAWEANLFSASYEIPHILWNPEVLYRLHKCPPPVPILSQLDPVHALTFHLLKFHINIILAYTPGFSVCSLSLRFPRQNPVSDSPLPPYVLHAPPICQHGMASARLWMEERLPMGRVAANILNMQSRTTDKGWSYNLGVGRDANNYST